MTESTGAIDHAVEDAVAPAPLPPPNVDLAAVPSGPGTASPPVSAPLAPPAAPPPVPAAASPTPQASFVPTMPANVAAKPSAPVAATKTTSASAFDVGAFLSSQQEKRAAPRRPRGRWFGRLAMVGLLGAGGWFGVQHGPELYEQYVEGDEAGAQNEPSAPLAFPNIAAPGPPIRTAEFTLSGLEETPNSTYRVTTDFETSVSQVDITRDDGPDLQILTYGSDAMIRRADGEQWYLLERGQFPLDGRLHRTDWVRSVDELFPVEVRDRIVIDTATRSTIAGDATRHLTLLVEPDLMGADVGVDPSDVTASLEDAQPTVPSAVRMEIWIDASGLVRQASGVPQLGADTITIVSTSPDAWIPAYPMASEIAPLTASALVELGL